MEISKVIPGASRKIGDSMSLLYGTLYGKGTQILPDRVIAFAQDSSTPSMLT